MKICFIKYRQILLHFEIFVTQIILDQKFILKNYKIKPSKFFKNTLELQQYSNDNET